MATHLYWRLNFASPTNGSNPAVAEIAMHTTVGGSNVCTGGTAGGTNINGSFPATNAFDGNTGTDCQTTSSSSTISYQFASAQAIVEYTVTSSASLAASFAPDTWTFEFSDNGTTWTVAHYVRNQVGWAATETRTFAVSEIGNAYLKAQLAAVQTTTPVGNGARLLAMRSAGTATTVNGVVSVLGAVTAGIIVVAYDKASRMPIGRAVSAADGSYSINCGGFTNVYVEAFDPTSYQMIGYDEVTPG
ncbi:hypothetical protein ACS7SF_02940 [Ralstonia sp. 25C]|uniref:hypothetical protein n=1 Tax=Ralstonia sp. 25C TaxID=3447363 RepID=UPI003F755C65